MKITLALCGFLAISSAKAEVNNVGFYATRNQQIFQKEDKREFDVGYVRGDDVPNFIWRGLLTGKKVYFEVHGSEMMMQVGTTSTTRSFRNAPALPGGDPGAPPLNDKGADIYVKSAKDPRQSLICVQSLGPDEYRRPRPYWEVYVVIDPLGTPRLYRLSGINADCRGLERAYDGTLLAPVWHVQKDATPEVEIKYYAFEKNRFRETGIRLTGTIQSEYADKYDINAVP